MPHRSEIRGSDFAMKPHTPIGTLRKSKDGDLGKQRCLCRREGIEGTQFRHHRCRIRRKPTETGPTCRCSTGGPCTRGGLLLKTAASPGSPVYEGLAGKAAPSLPSRWRRATLILAPWVPYQSQNRRKPRFKQLADGGPSRWPDARAKPLLPLLGVCPELSAVDAATPEDRAFCRFATARVAPAAEWCGWRRRRPVVTTLSSRSYCFAKPREGRSQVFAA
jgi:hypothetical protein